MTDHCISLKISLHLAIEPRSTLRDLSMSTLQPTHTLIVSKRFILECFLFIFHATILNPRTAHLNGTDRPFPMVDYPRIHPVCPHFVMRCDDVNIPKRLYILRFIQWLGSILEYYEGTSSNQLKVS